MCSGCVVRIICSMCMYVHVVTYHMSYVCVATVSYSMALQAVVPPSTVYLYRRPFSKYCTDAHTTVATCSYSSTTLQY